MSNAIDFLKAGPRALMRKSGLYSIYYLGRYGYLRQQNWFESYNRYEVIGPGGEPLPWLTYAAVHFLESRVKPTMSVFEFGSGNSTLWWARRVKEVVAVEHSQIWYERVKARMPENVRLLFAAIEDGAYAGSAAAQGRRFDVVLIDGRDRVNCVYKSVDALTPDGVFVWDNTDRAEYAPGYDFLRDRGFKRVDFHGMGPRCVEGWTTSVFYRSGNCLGI